MKEKENKTQKSSHENIKGIGKNLKKQQTKKCNKLKQEKRRKEKK